MPDFSTKGGVWKWGDAGEGLVKQGGRHGRCSEIRGIAISFSLIDREVRDSRVHMMLGGSGCLAGWAGASISCILVAPRNEGRRCQRE